MMQDAIPTSAVEGTIHVSSNSLKYAEDWNIDLFQADPLSNGGNCRRIALKLSISQSLIPLVVNKPSKQRGKIVIQEIVSGGKESNKETQDSLVYERKGTGSSMECNEGIENIQIGPADNITQVAHLMSTICKKKEETETRFKKHTPMITKFV